MQQSEISLKEIYRAKERISSIAWQTPLIPSPSLSELTGDSVYLKYEGLQPTGSFKIRGAANKLLSLSEEEKSRGVIAFSTGNHGRAVAAVAKQLGIRAVICLSNRVPQYRVEAMRQLGAEVAVHGVSQDEAYAYAIELQREQKLTMIKPFDDPFIIAGQGTIGLELMEDRPDIDTAIVPVSGGGLVAGIAFALKSADPSLRVIGVSMECAPAMYHCLKEGRPVEIEEKDSLADALLGGIGLDNRYTFPMTQTYVDDMVLVSEDEIARGMFFALDKHHLVVEGSGAVGIAALLSGKTANLGKNIAVVMSGSNVDIALLTRIAVEQQSPGT
ncbi:hydroxyectoine utilization dehydratase EutB [Desulfoferrobacter suflitae]|uniref:hydroxyectoine utilization dehydratase EutB n=1 Tax=Desulfoferrobacter suflitae TaxID=2865782 RepID=UPI002164A060|nr:hydroxyectoine utilization dehydratase EutB [Desulfoferrobacter suflitae]MCK8601436.1 hydroxyectoine utilization dehydratase EutB [Desulfoferrobacter suflitae]